MAGPTAATFVAPASRHARSNPCWPSTVTVRAGGDDEPVPALAPGASSRSVVGRALDVVNVDRARRPRRPRRGPLRYRRGSVREGGCVGPVSGRAFAAPRSARVAAPAAQQGGRPRSSPTGRGSVAVGRLRVALFGDRPEPSRATTVARQRPAGHRPRGRRRRRALRTPPRAGRARPARRVRPAGSGASSSSASAARSSAGASLRHSTARAPCAGAGRKSAGSSRSVMPVREAETVEPGGGEHHGVQVVTGAAQPRLDIAPDRHHRQVRTSRQELRRPSR